MKALIIGNDPMQEYLDKGFNIEERKRYFNPGNVYKEVFYLSHNPKLPPIIREAVLYFKALKIAKQNKVDIIRAYNGFRAGYIGSRVKRLLKIPLIISLHDDYDRLWDILNLSRPLKKLLLNNERIALEACDQCIVVSNYLDNYARLHGAKNTTVIFNKLNLKQYTDKTFTIVNIGRLNPSKNQTTIIQAVKLLRQEGLKIRLLLIGKGKLEPLIRKELGNQDGLINSVPNTYLPMILKQCNLFINASFNEGFCIALSEAQICGLPIISSRIPAVSDIVNEKNALFFDAANVEQLKEQIKKVYNHKEIREDMKEASTRDVQKFEWEHLAQQEKELIKRYKKIAN